MSRGGPLGGAQGTRAKTRGAPINKRAIRSDVRNNVVVAISADVVESLRAKFSAVLPHLDERQQRLVMAGEARSLGHGGIAAVAGATGVSRSRISLGVAELEAGVPPLGWARRTGGGRKSVTETDNRDVDTRSGCPRSLDLSFRRDPASGDHQCGVWEPLRRATAR